MQHRAYIATRGAGVVTLSDDYAPDVPLHDSETITINTDTFTVRHVDNFDSVPPCDVFALDIEAEIGSKIINCVQVCPIGGDTVYVTSGRKALSQAHNWLAQQAHNSATALVWDSQMESTMYPRCYDMQKDPSIVNPKGGKLGLHKCMLVTYGESLLDWHWVDHMPLAAYNKYSVTMDKQML